jgi:hypothetical protein
MQEDVCRVDPAQRAGGCGVDPAQRASGCGVDAAERGGGCRWIRRSEEGHVERMRLGSRRRKGSGWAGSQYETEAVAERRGGYGADPDSTGLQFVARKIDTLGVVISWIQMLILKIVNSTAHETSLRKQRGVTLPL